MHFDIAFVPEGLRNRVTPHLKSQTSVLSNVIYIQVWVKAEG